MPETTNINDKLEEAKGIIGDTAKDLQDLISFGQFTAAGVLTAIDRAKKRIVDIEKLFASEEDGNGKTTDA